MNRGLCHAIELIETTDIGVVLRTLNDSMTEVEAFVLTYLKNFRHASQTAPGLFVAREYPATQGTRRNGKPRLTVDIRSHSEG